MDARTKPELDHAAYQLAAKLKSVEQLRFIIADCRAALDAMPDNPKAGFYQDEIHYCAAELKRRGA